MTLARIDGAPAGIKGVSLFVVPKQRARGRHARRQRRRDARASIHKIGWRGLPSLALNFGEHGDCRGWLVGEPHQGIRYMFQMMNEARIMVGLNGVADRARSRTTRRSRTRATRPQGRPLRARRTPRRRRSPIIEHADVRRMLLRQKAIVEGGARARRRVALTAPISRRTRTRPTTRRRARCCSIC